MPRARARVTCPSSEVGSEPSLVASLCSVLALTASPGRQSRFAPSRDWVVTCATFVITAPAWSADAGRMTRL